MKDIKLKISEGSSQHYVETPAKALTIFEDTQRVKLNLPKNEKDINFDNSDVTAANLTEAIMKVGFEMMKKSEPLALSLIGGILIMIFGITGCSDVPYTGQIVTVQHVDQYLDSMEQDTLCLQDGFDSVCIKLMLDDVEVSGTNVDYTPVVHVHPTSLSYIFYYEDKPILYAKKGMDTSELIQELADVGRVQMPPNINNIGATGAQNEPEDWVIEIYYLNSGPQINRRLTLGNSGLDIRVVEGQRMLPNTQRDLRIRNFTETSGLNGSRGVQFSVETGAPNITVQVGGLVPGNTAKFHISADGVDSNAGTNILQLQPVQ